MTPVSSVVAALSLTQTQSDKYCCNSLYGVYLFYMPALAIHFHIFSVSSFTAMSSYLYIVKSELPLVIQAFLKADPNAEWVLSFMFMLYLFIYIINISVLLVNTTWFPPAVGPESRHCVRVKGLVTDCGQQIFSLHQSLSQCGSVMKMEACNWWSDVGPWYGICQLCIHTT